MGTLLWRALCLPLLFLSAAFSTPSWGKLRPGEEQYPPHVRYLLGHEGHKEVTYNSSPVIDMWNKFVGNPRKSSYCAAAVCRSLHESDSTLTKFKTGLAMNLRNRETISARKVLLLGYEVQVGDILVWQKGETIFGHTGLALLWKKDRGETIEANTSSGTKGSQSNGNMTCRRRRTIEPYGYMRIKYITPVRTLGA